MHTKRQKNTGEIDKMTLQKKQTQADKKYISFFKSNREGDTYIKRVRQRYKETEIYKIGFREKEEKIYGDKEREKAKEIIK